VVARRGRTARGEADVDGRDGRRWETYDNARVSGRGVALGRSGASLRGSMSGWGLLSGRSASGMGTTRRGSSDDGDEERPGDDLGEKRLSADLEGDETYIEPPFCHGL
jgi:hypothetical protein